jgi:hypothetical protein
MDNASTPNKGRKRCRTRENFFDDVSAGKSKCKICSMVFSNNTETLRHHIDGHVKAGNIPGNLADLPHTPIKVHSSAVLSRSPDNVTAKHWQHKRAHMDLLHENGLQKRTNR